MEVVVGLFMFATGLFMTGRLYQLNCHQQIEKRTLVTSTVATDQANTL